MHSKVWCVHWQKQLWSAQLMELMNEIDETTISIKIVIISILSEVFKTSKSHLMVMLLISTLFHISLPLPILIDDKIISRISKR